MSTLVVTLMPVEVRIGVLVFATDVTGAPLGPRWHPVGRPIIRFVSVPAAWSTRPA